MLRVVTYLPSCPAKGDVLMRNDMLTVGSSTLIVGSGMRIEAAQTVSPMLALASPANKEKGVRDRTWSPQGDAHRGRTDGVADARVG